MEQVYLKICLFTTIIVTFASLNGSQTLEDGSRCTPVAIIGCLHLLDMANISQSTFTIFTEEDLNQICVVEFESLKSCLKPLREDCDPTLSVAFKTVEDHLEYTCSKEGLEGHLTHGVCLNDTTVLEELNKCVEDHMEKSRRSTGFETDYAEKLCGLQVIYTECVKEAGQRFCGAEAAEWLSGISESSSQAVMDLLSCSEITKNLDSTSTTVTTTTPTTTTTKLISIESKNAMTTVAPLCTSAEIEICMRYLDKYQPELFSLDLLSGFNIEDLCRLFTLSVLKKRGIIIVTHQINMSISDIITATHDEIVMLKVSIKNSRLPQFDDCIEPKLESCSQRQKEDILLFKNTFTSACDEQKSPAAAEHKKCIGKPDVSRQLQVCSSIHKSEALNSNYIQKTTTTDDQYWCRITQKYLNCVVNTTDRSCGAGSSLWLWKATMFILQPTAKRLDCILVYEPMPIELMQQGISDGAVIGIGVAVLVFILLLVLLITCLLCYCHPRPSHYTRKGRTDSTKVLHYPNLTYLDYSDIDIKTSVPSSYRSKISFISFDMP